MAKYIAEHPTLEEGTSSKKVKKAPEVPPSVEAVIRKFVPVVCHCLVSSTICDLLCL